MTSNQSSPGAVSAASSPLAPAMSSPSSISIMPTSALSPAPFTPASITTKEWVIPPRPKPGRKPATDTPPTKRKAQNRAAQRAFRERRAARVGELEEHIKKIEDEHNAELRDNITKLTSELEYFKGQIEWWKARCRKLEKDLDVEKKQTSKLLSESRLRADKKRADTTQTRAEAEPPDVQNQDMSVGCGNCSSTSRCACIEQFANITDLASNTKRPSSPQSSSDSKRLRSDQEDRQRPEELETDFTAQFSSAKLASNVPTAHGSPATIADPCGFCQDGTACICAEMAAEVSDGMSNAHALSQFTPPPSEGDVLQLPIGPKNQASSCGNSPGTCTQCRSDPNSTLFCKTLAASRVASASTAGCAGASAKGACCQTRSAAVSRTAITPSDPLQLSCADVYTTLSRHRNYARASNEMGTWLPKLHTLPAMSGDRMSEAEKQRQRAEAIDVAGRPAMDIEAASVMGVLKYFDRRFGKETD